MHHPHGTAEEHHEHGHDDDDQGHGHGHGHHHPGIRGRGGFIISGLTGGHGVFHWFTQSFIAMLPEVRDAFALGAVSVGGITSVRELVSGLGNIARRHYRGRAAEALGAGSRAVHGVLRRGLANHRLRAQLSLAALGHGGRRARRVDMALAGDGVLVAPLLSPQGHRAVVSWRGRADWRCACASGYGLPARLSRVARDNQHLRRIAYLPCLRGLLGVQEHRQDGTGR